MASHKKHLKFIYSLGVLMCIFVAQTIAQPAWKVDLEGGIKDEDSKQAIEGAKIEILKDASIIKTIYANEKGKFQYFLSPNNEYTIKVSSPGYVSKLISVSTTNVPDKVDVTGNFIVKMQVSLFHKVPGIDFSLLDKPVGSIFYEPKENNFDFDVDASIGEKMEQLQKQYDQNIKEQAAQAKREKDDAEKKATIERLATEKAEKDAKKNAAKDAADAEKEEKKRKAQEEKDKKESAKKEAAQKPEIEDKEDDNRKKSEEERAERKQLEKEAYEAAKAKIKQKAEEKKEKEIKAKEAAQEKIKNKGLKKQEIVKEVIKASEIAVVNVENIRSSQSEGTNYTINHTFVTLNGEEIEYKKIVFSWGGVYFKRAELDISNNTYVLEMKIYGVIPISK